MEVEGPVTGWYWLSFCDAARPEGTQFLGACLVQARDMAGAVGMADHLGCNPGGEVWGLGPVPEEARWWPLDWTGRLLSREECAVFDKLMGPRPRIV